jgi:hypothetical protein
MLNGEGWLKIACILKIVYNIHNTSNIEKGIFKKKSSRPIPKLISENYLDLTSIGQSVHITDQIDL